MQNENIKELKQINIQEIDEFVLKIKKYKMLRTIREMYDFLIKNWDIEIETNISFKSKHIIQNYIPREGFQERTIN
jgi:hypothetical protein